MKKSIFLFAACFLLLEASSIDAINEIHMATNPITGTSIAAWPEFFGGEFIINSRIESVAGIWAAVNPLSSSGLCVGARLPKVAITDLDRVIAVWKGRDPITNNEGLYGAFYFLGTWQTSQLISDPNEIVDDDYFNVEMTSSILGAILSKVTWTSYDTVSGQRVARVKTNLTFGTWGSITSINL